MNAPEARSGFPLTAGDGPQTISRACTMNNQTDDREQGSDVRELAAEELAVAVGGLFGIGAAVANAAARQREARGTGIIAVLIG